MAYEQVLYDVRGEVALITLNRPDRLNAWTRRMGAELADAVGTANADGSVGAIVFTGAGRAFCAGADVESQFKAQLDGATDLAGRDEDLPPATSWVGLCRESKPMVAAINGHAIGIGLTLALPMDHLIASDAAKISCRFVKMGITPELASSHFLVARCGWGAASDLALSGRIVEAEDALRMRLVDAVVPAESLLEAALAKAADYASNPDPQLRMIKELLTLNASETDLAQVQRREMAALKRSFATPEFAEAVDAFLNKRPARFR
jgi:enoyl-CoA hydratase/carnithine racemase